MASKINEQAGSPAKRENLVNIHRLMSLYYGIQPDPKEATQKIIFGTSGHRGTSFDGNFNEHHVLAICQAICEFRKSNGIDGYLFIGMDTHALSEAAYQTAIEVFVANEVYVRVQEGFGYTPTPAISHAILENNREANNPVAD